MKEMRHGVAGLMGRVRSTIRHVGADILPEECAYCAQRVQESEWVVNALTALTQ